ncbi:MAG: AMP-binding protein, partial [bacterium]|nr:AMP-binding protein [bacterium]
TVSGRPAELPGVESIAGLFINTLPVRMQVDPGALLVPWLERLQARQAELRRYEHSPLDQVQKWSGLPAGQALFDHILVFENYPVSSALQESPPGLEITEVQPSEQTHYPLTVAVLPGSEIELGLSYDSRHFDHMAILRMAGHLENLLQAFVADPQSRLAELGLLTPAERQQLVVEWNVSGRDSNRWEGAWDRCSVHELFEAQVARSPEAAAVIRDGRELSYGELERRASGVARRLVELGVGPETVVGLWAERSFGMLEGMLGILKAGGIYLPLDPGSPRERLAFMLEDSGARVLVTVGAARDLPAGGRPVVAVAEAGAVGERLPGRWVSPKQGAYVIYTSGSTGRPKGVLVSHRSLASYAARAADAYGIEPGDRALQFASMSFDASAEEIYPTLVRGAALVLRSDELAPAPQFLDECRAAGITVLNLPTAYWHTLMADAGEGGAWPESVRLVIIGGEEALPEALECWQRWVGDEVRLVNTYGPTEATIVATRWQPGAQSAAREQLARVPIGRPAAGARTYVLDGRL